MYTEIKNKEQKIGNLQKKAKLSGVETTSEQILFLYAELEKEWVFNSYLRERGLEFVNERTRESVAGDFDRMILNPKNKDFKFEEILNSLITDENGDIIWDLFTPESGKKHRLSVYGENTDNAKILPPCGNSDVYESINPFDKDNWDMAAQSKIYKETPEIAKYLASAAKQKLF